MVYSFSICLRCAGVYWSDTNAFNGMSAVNKQPKMESAEALFRWLRHSKFPVYGRNKFICIERGCLCSLRAKVLRWICAIACRFRCFTDHRMSLRILSNFSLAMATHSFAIFINPMNQFWMHSPRTRPLFNRRVGRREEHMGQRPVRVATGAQWFCFHIFIRANEFVECWARGSDKRLRA